MKETVVVGVSGGVDSSVCAYLLKEDGYNVIGATMLTGDFSGTQESTIKEAKRICDLLEIPHITLDYSKQFKEEIIEGYFIKEYLSGRTPNPCVMCNRQIKFEMLRSYASEIGAQYIATGHYARPVLLENGRYSLQMADNEKDQTYALFNLSQEQLSMLKLPLGERGLTKSEVREIAQKIHIDVANKPDSQDICFIPDGNYSAFISESSTMESKKGLFLDFEGNSYGEHKGIANYTIGQRKGLGIAFGIPMYVCRIDAESGNVILGPNDKLFNTRVLVKSFNAVGMERPDKETRVFGKIRYAQKKSPCTIYMEEDVLYCEFDEPQRAITSGQAAVFYDENNVLLGGGIII